MSQPLGPVHSVVVTAPRDGEIYHDHFIGLVGSTDFDLSNPAQIRFNDKDFLLADANEIVYWPDAEGDESPHYVIDLPPEVKNAETARKHLELFPADFNVDLALAMGFHKVDY